MRKMKVLLVDDEIDFLDVMGARIKEWGYDVLRASSGKDALQLVEKNKPDVIVLDYMLPGMDGVATLKHIRKIDEKVPVIMFTAYPNTDTIGDTEKLGICAFIPKLSLYSDVLGSLKASLKMIEKTIV